jgi:septum formation protein
MDNPLDYLHPDSLASDSLQPDSITFDPLHGRRIVLASQSPRRRELLSMLRVPFSVEPAKDSAEAFRPDMPHDLIPEFLANHKSATFHRDLAPDEILLTADTLVFCDKNILGKPKDREDAIRMIKLLSGRTHQVITGVVLRTSKDRISFHETTEVTFRVLTDNEISYYVDTFKPYDKAGAYAIQEWIGSVAITKIDGSYSNVVGLPTARLYQALLSI